MAAEHEGGLPAGAGAAELDEPYLPEDDASDGELEAQYPMPVFNDTLDNAVVVDGVPVVAEDKLEKLFNLLETLFSQIGPIAEDGILIPLDEKTKKTKGCVAPGMQCRVWRTRSQRGF